ncbi:putative lysine-specific demethylase JMJ16 [Camellia lanceoleosa]|uniref:Lysine-specific demethylase JMJ16 n=1 Tax=Camellia lanceoleosa TaxID=1840588 RepID=A0ACC0H1B0_9ERIC|nr:putative lysine-specific demethylase JMJ16 [Camellia lanceoleosa]
MAKELVRPRIKEENMEISSVPPGFESFTSFTRKRVENKKMATCSTFGSASEPRTVQMETEYNSREDAKITRSLRPRLRKNSSRYDNNYGHESDSEQLVRLIQEIETIFCTTTANCPPCDKVTARWCPEEACRPDLEEVPVFYPNEEEFKDTLYYIASIRPRAETYGICCIVPPPSWKPPCPLKEKKIWERSKFRTRIQRVNKLQNRDSMKKMLKTHNNKRKRRRCMKNRVDYGTGTKINLSPGEAGICEAECFGFERGPEFTLDTFQQYADTFKVQYFRKSESIADPGGNMTTFQEQWEPSAENIEGEYWQMVEKPTEEIEVLYGADLETGVFGSGFPKISNQGGSLSEKYTKSGWNLNNFPRLSGSVLSYESSDISGVLVPRLYIGMCFSSFCWHVEDHHLYSLNYMHWGAPKTWYGVPGKDALKLEAAMRKHLPDLFEEQPDLLHKLVTQLSSSVVKSDGVPVYRCVQNSGEFILTFPRAYHSGFNCAEAVNVAPVDWLPHGQDAIELYLEQGRKTTISHDKLLFGAAREAVKAHWELDLLGKNTSDNLRWKEVCGKDGILTKVLKRDACLNHAEQLCSCSWSAKFFLFRYDINELDVLAKALEGKLSAVYRWGKQDLRLALSPYVSKDNPQFPGLIANLSCSSQPSATSLKGTEEKEMLDEIPKSRGLKDVKASSTSPKSSYEFKVANCSSQKIKKEAFHLGHNLRTSFCQLSQEDDTDNLARVKLEVKKKKSSFSGNDNVILLSDDEGEKSNMPLSEREKQTSEKHTKHFERLSGFVNTMSASNCVKGSNLTSPVTKVKVMGEGDQNLLPDREKNKFPSSTDFNKNVEDFSNTKEAGDCNNMDRYFHQKGPRIAKVVRRINCNVEPLEYGIVHSGKLWCDSRAIFPKGFKSRVRYISVLDPTKAYYYVSEILDAAWDRPLFMVSVEHCPSEVFIHVSAAKCWEMVRERVNQEIMKQHKLGRMRLPPLQPHGSLDGFEMFGFFSPAILQVIQAMDQNRICTEYWKSHPQMQIPQHFQYQENEDSRSSDLKRKKKRQAARSAEEKTSSTIPPTAGRFLGEMNSKKVLSYGLVN